MTEKQMMEEKESKEVWFQVYRLNVKTTALQQMINRLKNKLNPVLSDSSRLKKEELNKKEEDICPLASALRRTSMSLSDCQDTILDIEDRLEI